jgi:Phage Tail Collar Domain
MTLPIVPVVPEPASGTFAEDAYVFTRFMADFATALPEEIDRINALGAGSYNSTSSTSLTVGLGSKSLTVETGKGYVAGQAVMIAQTNDPINYMTGQVISYNSTTGALVVNVTDVGGSGTGTDWTISVTAIAGAEAFAVGDVLFSNRVPTGGWLPCDGRIYLQSAYPDLFAKLGTRFQNYAGDTTTNSPLPKNPSKIKWLNSQFVALTNDTTNTTQFYTSTNGTTWTGRTAPQLNGWSDVVYGDGYYVAISSSAGSNRVARSTDGVSWVSATSAPDTNSWSSLAHNGNGVFVAISYDGTNRVTRSTNAGANWSGISVPLRDWSKIIWTGNKFVAFSSQYSMHSTDGLSWTEYSITGIGTPQIDTPKVVWTGSEFIAKTSQGILSFAISSDGINFSHTEASPPINSVIGVYDMVYELGALFVLTNVSSGGYNLLITHDLYNWQLSWSNSTSTANSGKIALSNTGTLLIANSTASNSRNIGYSTATQFVVPAVGSKAYIKAEA